MQLNVILAASESQVNCLTTLVYQIKIGMSIVRQIFH